MMSNAHENLIWYLGNGDKLLEYYTRFTLKDGNKNAIYNRNKMNYFWCASATETNIKRVHSGIPNAIVTTLTNAIGVPDISSIDTNTNQKIKEIVEANDYKTMLNQQQMPLTMAEGWGAYKITYDTNYSKIPLIEFYDGERVELKYKYNILQEVVFSDYYKYKNKNYTLKEYRRKANGNSIIEWKLFDDDTLDEVPLKKVPELENLQPVVITGLDEVLAEPCKYFFDPENKDYGRSIFEGKIDLFDDLDQILSQDSQTVRVSTPVEYFPTDLLEKSANGLPKLPSAFNRQFIEIDSVPNGDGLSTSKIQSSQPNLNFSQYSEEAKAKLDYILIGILAPASLGIDVAKKDNAEAQREKEKITLMTVNNIVASQERSTSRLMKLCLYMYDYLKFGKITYGIYDDKVSVKFKEFATPSFESKLETLLPALASNAISLERYVDLLWGDKLTAEEKAQEVEILRQQQQIDNLGVEVLDERRDSEVREFEESEE